MTEADSVDSILAGIELEEDALYVVMLSAYGYPPTIYDYGYGPDAVRQRVWSAAQMRGVDRIMVMPISRTLLVDWRRDAE